MSTKKISGMDSLGGAPDSSDLVVVVDISDTTESPQGTTKKNTYGNFTSNFAKYNDVTANFTGVLQQGGDDVLDAGDIDQVGGVQSYDANTAKYNIASNFTGTLQQGGNNVLDEGGIGSVSQGYDINTVKYNDATANFTGVLQQGGDDVLTVASIGTSVQAYDANLTSCVATFTLPTVDGTDGQVLGTDGLGNLTFVDAGGGGGITATANGAITAGDPVIVNTDGTVSAVSGAVTDEDFIGFSEGTYADTDTASIQTLGSVNSSQSGLTAAEAYYVQTNGTLATTGTVYAGIALSATEILIKG